MIKRWVTPFAVLGAFAALASQATLQAQPPVASAPPAAVPAWIPPPAPAPPATLWRFLGIPQGFQRIGDARLNRNGNFPGLERKPPLKPIAHPDNLLSNNPAIKKAAEIKMQEDLAKQKIKAIKYLAKLGCDKCYGGVKEALMAALDDCTEQVRYEASKAIGEAAVQHCELCSRQCCCDEELTKKLAQIVYEMDDKCCPLEPSERVRNAAKEALQACCPNVGPPGLPEEVGPERPPERPPETPPEVPPETPPETPPELPPPPGRNGVAPLPNDVIPPPPGRNGVAPRPNGNGVPPATLPPMPTTRPRLPPEGSTQLFLRSRADRMVATSQVQRAPVVQRPAARGSQAAAQQPPIVELPVRQTLGERPAARLVISDEAPTRLNESAAKVTVGDSNAEGQALLVDPSRNAIRIRTSSNNSRSASAAVGPTATPHPKMPPASATSGTTVRIRDNTGDLQLASAQEEPADIAELTSRPNPRHNVAIVSDLFTPPAATETPAVVEQPPRALVVSVKPQGESTKAQGKVSDIDVRGGTVRFSFKADQAPSVGSLVKVYHQFLMGEECVGALEVVSVQKGVASARPVGNFNVTRLALQDEVAYNSSGADVTARTVTTRPTKPATNSAR